MYVALSVYRSIDGTTPPIASSRFVLFPAILPAIRSINTALQSPTESLKKRLFFDPRQILLPEAHLTVQYDFAVSAISLRLVQYGIYFT